METIPIPGPPGLPLLGNIADIDTKDLVMSISKLADTYGISLQFRISQS
jgi:cytochrome P450/NADPH-cytochrome P450 reductase